MSEYVVDVGNADEEHVDTFCARMERCFGHPVREKLTRCRDCRFWATEHRFTGKCVGRGLDPDGFCAWGERMEP